MGLEEDVALVIKLRLHLLPECDSLRFPPRWALCNSWMGLCYWVLILRLGALAVVEIFLNRRILCLWPHQVILLGQHLALLQEVVNVVAYHHRRVYLEILDIDLGV